jgi:hypothetical protein
MHHLQMILGRESTLDVRLQRPYSSRGRSGTKTSAASARRQRETRTRTQCNKVMYHGWFLYFAHSVVSQMLFYREILKKIDFADSTV